MSKGLLAALLLCAAPAGAEIYKWTDADGRVHYSDRKASANAKVVDVKINSYRSVTYSSLPPWPAPAKAARRDDILLYGTEWCGYCKKARRYFEDNGIAYAWLDIEKDAAAKQAFNALGGRGVPVIVAGERRMNGFSEQGIRQLLRP